MAEFFTDQYREEVFLLWYNGGRKISNRFTNSLPEENSTRPTPKTVEKWRDSYGWIERAEVLDTELSERLKDKMINDRVEMYEKHVQLASDLIEKGKVFLQTHELKDSSDALKAIALGIDIEKASVGQAEVGRKILTMSNDQLERELLKLLGKQTPVSDEFIDADVESEED